MNKLSLDAFSLKLIAIITMGIQHTIIVLWEIFPIWAILPLQIVRGITFPIMAFFVVEGFRRSTNINKYMLRLFVFACVAQIPYILAFGLSMLNIIFTILLGLVILKMYENLYVEKSKRGLFVVLFILISIVSVGFFEGGLVGPILIFMFHVIKDEKKRRLWPLIFWGVTTLVFGLLNRLTFGFMDADAVAEMGTLMQFELMMAQHWVFPLGPFLVIPLLLAYNGERGRKAKYLFYAFYPGHLAVLAIISFALGLSALPFNL